LLTSCASHGPQLTTLYKTSGETGRQPPVILIHGAFDGRLCDQQGEEHWPGSFFNILVSDYRSLLLPVPAAEEHGPQAKLTVCALTDTVAGRDF